MAEESAATNRQRSRATRSDDDRQRMRAVANNLVLHLHPTKVPTPALRWQRTWGLGGISTVLVLILVSTGVLLMFRYDASVETAYASIQVLETQVLFGALVRSLHHWSANLLVVTAFLHLLRVFYSGGFKGGRSRNWTVGLILLFVVLAFNFTGYLLPWDQLAYWAITVGTSLLSYVPLIGAGLQQFLVAGPEVGQAALRNFYALHVAVLPLLLLGLLSYHFWKVRKDGGIVLPAADNGERIERVTTIPHLVQIELAATLVVVTLLLAWAALVPAPLEALANPLQPPNPAKAAWYFLGLQELLLHMHPLAAMILAGLVTSGFFLAPRLDRRGETIGIYFRSPAGRRLALAGALLALALVPLLTLVDELWIDLPRLLPTWPLLISTGLVPLLLSLFGLGLIYLLFRTLDGINHGEALVGLFTFISTALVVMTLVGIFFRGPNMVLVAPF